jgi:uncharacterized protein
LGQGGVSLDDTLLLIEPGVAKRYANEQQSLKVQTNDLDGKKAGLTSANQGATDVAEPGSKPNGAAPAPTAKVKSFRGSVDVNPTLAKSRLNTIADEVIALLGSDPNATLRITLAIDAEFPKGASDTIKRGVSENATSLGFKTKDWE